MVLGNFNGRVGERIDGYEGVHGGFGHGTRNMEGRRVLEFCDLHGMVVGNTLFKRASERLVTYRSGDNMSMIDYVLVRAKDRKFIRNVKVILGVLQHGMVVMDVVRADVGRHVKENFVPRRKTWLLRKTEVKEEF